MTFLEVLQILTVTLIIAGGIVTYKLYRLK